MYFRIVSNIGQIAALCDVGPYISQRARTQILLSLNLLQMAWHFEIFFHQKAQKKNSVYLGILYRGESCAKGKRAWMKSKSWWHNLSRKAKDKGQASVCESVLAVQGAVDRVWWGDRYARFNVTAVNGVAQYTQCKSLLTTKITELSSTCQTLVAGFEEDVVHFFYTKKGTSEVQAAKRAICTDSTKLCWASLSAAATSAVATRLS